MYCDNCGKEIKDNIVYCRYCGKKINSSVVDKLENNLENLGITSEGKFFSLGEITDNSRKSEFYFQEGLKKFDQGEYIEAIEYISKTLELDPKAINCYANIAVAYLKLNDYQNAISWYLKGLSHMPTDLSLLHDLSKAYYLAKDLERALKIVEYLRVLAPENLYYQNLENSLKSEIK